MASCFVSYATADRPFVETHLLDLLRAIGIEPWYDQKDIGTAEEWERSIRHGLESCDWFMLVMSPDAARSPWIKDELHWALEQRPERVIPICIASCDPAAFHIRLARLQFVDFTKNFDAARNKLIEVLVDLQFRPLRPASAIQGAWKGRLKQETGPDGAPIEYDGDLQLQVNRQTIKGRLVVDNTYARGPKTLVFDISGGSLYERFLQLSYFSANPHFIQFGAFVHRRDLRASDRGTTEGVAQDQIRGCRSAARRITLRNWSPCPRRREARRLGARRWSMRIRRRQLDGAPNAASSSITTGSRTPTEARRRSITSSCAAAPTIPMKRSAGLELEKKI